MKQFYLLMLSLMLSQVTFGQYVTHNYDVPKRNQITVMEIGTGALSPDAYYLLLHNSYKKTAATKNKLSYRTSAGIGAYQQVDYAEEIDSLLTKRAEIEALTMADCNIDLAWRTEGDKINTMMDRFLTNMNRIVPAGGTPNDRKRWAEYYSMFNCAIKSTKEAYMPNAQRKKQYLRIYNDLVTQNDLLVRYLVMLNSNSLTKEALSATNVFEINKNSIVEEARNRWKQAHLSNMTNGSWDNSDDGNEQVNK